jgi:syntaxin 8
MSTPRLSSMSFQTLSLLLERQRLRTLGKVPPASQLPTIQRNMGILREGILDLERQSATESTLKNGANGVSETRKAVEELRSQWQRAWRLLGEEGTDLEE